MFICDSCKVVEVAVPATYCDRCVEEIIAYLEREEEERALLAKHYDLEYQRLYEDGLGFSY